MDLATSTDGSRDDYWQTTDAQRPAQSLTPFQQSKLHMHRLQKQSMARSIQMSNEGIRYLVHGQESHAFELLSMAMTNIRHSVPRRPAVDPSQHARTTSRQEPAVGPTASTNGLYVANNDGSSSRNNSDGGIIDDDSDDVVALDAFHTPVPISPAAAGPYFDSRQHKDDAVPPQLGVFAYSKAFLLSQDAIHAAEDHHRMVRRVEYECEVNEEQYVPFEENLDVQLSVEDEFLCTVLPVVCAAIVHNMALAVDSQSRRMLTAVQAASAPRTGRTGSPAAHEQAFVDTCRMNALGCASKAQHLYQSVLRLIKPEHWQSSTTAALLRVAGTNNYAACRLLVDGIQQQLSPQSSQSNAAITQQQEWLEESGQDILGIARYTGVDLRSSSAGQNHAAETARDVEAMVSNACLWIMGTGTPSVSQRVAPAA